MEEIQALLESSKYAPLTASDSAAMKLMLENTEKEYHKLVLSRFLPQVLPWHKVCLMNYCIVRIHQS